MNWKGKALALVGTAAWCYLVVVIIWQAIGGLLTTMTGTLAVLCVFIGGVIGVIALIEYNGVINEVRAWQIAKEDREKYGGQK